MKQIKFLTRFALVPALVSTFVAAYAAGTASMPLSRLMVEVINPAANTVLDAGSKGALSIQDWNSINRAVAVLSAASGAVARGGAFAGEQPAARLPQWREWSQKYTATLRLARRASDRRDQHALNAAGKALVDVCQGCHMLVAIGSH